MSTDLYDDLFKRFGEAYGVPWELLKAQVAAESNFDPLAVSRHGAEGLAQFMPATWREWATRVGLPDASAFNPDAAIHVQAAYMAHLQERFGDWQKSLAAYNWGMGNLAKIVEDVEWQAQLPHETQHYVTKIMNAVKGLFGVT